MFDIFFIVAALIMASMQPSDNSEREIMQTPPETVCREADGRIRLGCLPEGTVRPLPAEDIPDADSDTGDTAKEDARSDCNLSKKDPKSA